MSRSKTVNWKEREGALWRKLQKLEERLERMAAVNPRSDTYHQVYNSYTRCESAWRRAVGRAYPLTQEER